MRRAHSRFANCRTEGRQSPKKSRFHLGAAKKASYSLEGITDAKKDVEDMIIPAIIGTECVIEGESEAHLLGEHIVPAESDTESERAIGASNGFGVIVDFDV